MNDEELVSYGDGSIQEKDAKVSLWLKISYVVTFFWGLLWLFLYFNGISGYLDRGYWSQLEEAANTTRARFFYDNDNK